MILRKAIASSPDNAKTPARPSFYDKNKLGRASPRPKGYPEWVVYTNKAEELNNAEWAA